MGKRLYIILVLVATVAAVLFWQFYPRVTETPVVDAGKEAVRPEPAAELAGLKCKGCNVVIISLTNTRKDHLGIYGYQRPVSKNIDAFFKDSIIFENAFAPASWTLPVAASLYSSLFPYTHGVMDRYDGSRLSEDVWTLTEILSENGYKTAGFTGGGDYNRSFNISQGFDLYLDESNYAEYGLQEIDPTGVKNTPPAAYLSIEKLAPLALKWLKDNRDGKMFLLLQGYNFAPCFDLSGKFWGFPACFG